MDILFCYMSNVISIDTIMFSVMTNIGFDIHQFNFDQSPVKFSTEVCVLATTLNYI